MDGKSNIQVVIERQREVYANDLSRPLFAQIMQFYRISLRNFAEMFGVSKSHAEDLYSHRKLPSLELALRVARYCECTVEDLFGWRVDDDGMRRPLMAELPGTTILAKIPVKSKTHTTMGLVQWMIAVLREKRMENQNAEIQTKDGMDGTL